MKLITKEKEYDLKLNLMSCIILEKELKQNPLNLFIGMSEDNLPKLEDLVTIIKCAGKEYFKTYEDVCNCIDIWFSEGNSLMELVDIVVGLFKESGLVAKDGKLKN